MCLILFYKASILDFTSSKVFLVFLPPIFWTKGMGSTSGLGFGTGDEHMMIVDHS